MTFRMRALYTLRGGADIRHDVATRSSHAMSDLDICLVSSEVAPFAKTGGLADVTAALARYLSRAGHDVRTFLPLYKRIAQGQHTLTPVAGLQDLSMKFAGRVVRYSIWTTPITKSEAQLYLVKCPEFYDREGIYDSSGDEHLRFAFLSRAAIEACQHMRFSPHVFHANDWHTALIPLYLKTVYAWDRLFARSRTVLTLHNNAYQGIFPTSIAGDIGLENEARYFHQEDWREGRLGFLKTGILYATAVSTVSKTYAKEIQGDELGMGLQGLLRQRDDHLFGILNGVDVDEWSPANDTLIPHRFTKEDLSGKAAMKQALMKKAGLPHEPRVPVVGIVSRFTAQKGFELLTDAMTVFLQRENMRLVVLGSGDVFPGASTLDPVLDGFRLTPADANLQCCVDKAKGAIERDHLDQRRPARGGYDIGAYELPP
jgi:starch synthase